jgi:hypothetical protein
MLIIDVSNVLHVTAVLPADLAGLDFFRPHQGLHPNAEHVPMDGTMGLAALIAHSRYASHQVIMVCDGELHPAYRSSVNTLSSTWNIHLRHSGSHQEADDVVESLLQQTPRSQRAIVISADRRLIKAAGKARARTLRPEVFLHHLAIDVHHQPARAVPGYRRPAFATDIPLDPISTDHWLKQFGVSKDLASIPSGKPIRADQRASTPVQAPTRSRKARETADLDPKQREPDQWDMARWLARFPPSMAAKLGNPRGPLDGGALRSSRR